MWSFAARCESKARLDKKTAIVTGSSSGIGKATALELVHRGARVLMACPDLAQAEAALQEIRCQTRDLPGAGVAMVVHLDLASLASVRKCAQYILDSEDHIHLLINNAGVCYAPELYTEDGFEMHLGVNYFGHFLLTCLLLPRIIRTGSARIINVSSKMAYFARKDFIDNLHGKKQSYSAWYGYAESKLAIILFTTELARRLQDTSVKTYALHPGSVATDAAHWFSPYMRWFYSVVLGYIFKTPEQGAQTTIHCAVDEEAGKETGLYYRNCSVSEPPALASDIELAQKLWEKSILLVGLEGWDPFKS